MQMYISGGDSKVKSLRDQYTRRIQEQENLGKALRDKQKEIKQRHGSCMNQVRVHLFIANVTCLYLGENVE